MHPSDRGRLLALDGNWQEGGVPRQNEVITRPFIVDSRSMQPVPVRVVQRIEWHHSATPTFVLVVRPATSIDES